MKKIMALLAATFFSTGAFCGFIEGEEAFKKQQYSQAFSEFLPLANEGDYRAQYYIAYLYLNGLGTPRDVKISLRYLRRSLEHNYDSAQALMGYLYSEGIGLRQNKKKALEMYEAAAAQNNISANLNLGVMYYTGDGVTRNYNKALEYFNKVPVSEKPIVSRYLGEIYLNNNALQDYAKAFQNYSASANYGDVIAYYALGNMYQKGQYVYMDPETALMYYRYAATQNHAPAQYTLGLMYANGDGVARDMAKGYAWLSLAAEQQLEVAKNARDKLASTMSQTDLNSARREIINIQQTEMGKIEAPAVTQSKVSVAPVKSGARRIIRRRRR